MNGTATKLVQTRATWIVHCVSTMSKYPDYLSPTATQGQKSRARREPSGVFSLFQAPQVQQFKEAFQLIDHDKDGWVNESDLKEIFTSLGEPGYVPRMLEISCAC